MGCQNASWNNTNSSKFFSRKHPQADTPIPDRERRSGLIMIWAAKCPSAIKKKKKLPKTLLEEVPFK